MASHSQLDELILPGKDLIENEIFVLTSARQRNDIIVHKLKCSSKVVVEMYRIMFNVESPTQHDIRHSTAQHNTAQHNKDS